MVSEENKSLQSTALLGYWSALLIIVVSVSYAATIVPVIKGFMAAPTVSFSIESYATMLKTSDIFTNGFLPQLMNVIYVILCVITSACVYQYATLDKKVFALLSLCFTVIAATLMTMVYFTQWTSLRFSALAGDYAGLSQCAQGNIHSFAFAMLILSFHIFLCLGWLALAPVFFGHVKGKSIAWLLVFIGVLGGVSIIALVTNIVPLYFIHDGLGGIVVIIVSILLMKFWNTIARNQ
jgi:hypothetical protein